MPVASPHPTLASLLPPLVASLTLGLAPFAPQPHLLEKLRWLATGHPFRAVDLFDLALHASPWIWLIVRIALLRVRRSRPLTG